MPKQKQYLKNYEIPCIGSDELVKTLQDLTQSGDAKLTNDAVVDIARCVTELQDDSFDHGVRCTLAELNECNES